MPEDEENKNQECNPEKITLSLSQVNRLLIAKKKMLRRLAEIKKEEELKNKNTEEEQ